MLFGQADLVVTKGRAVRVEAVLLVRGTIAEVRAHQDQRGPRRVRTCGVQRGVDRGQVAAVRHRYRMPAVRLEAFGAIFRERDVGAGGKGDAVVRVEAGQLAEPQMPGERGRLRGNALHQVAVAGQHIRGVVDHRVVRAVVARCELRFHDRHADGVGETLPERPGRGLHARGEPAFRMPWRLAAPLTEARDLVERQGVAGEVQEAIQQHRPMPG